MAIGATEWCIKRLSCIVCLAATDVCTYQQQSTPVDMKEITRALCEEADRVKTRRALKDGQGKGKKEGQTDEALAVTSSEGGGKKKRRKGECHHCGKQGHCQRECRTKKKEEENDNRADRQPRRPQETTVNPKTSRWAPRTS